MSNKLVILDILRQRKISSLFQPIVDIENTAIWGYEALTRGPAETALYSPIVLFDMAEKYGLLKNLESICIQSASLHFNQLGLSGKLFVNISHEVLIAGSQIEKQIVDLLLNSQLKPSNVVIELTERSTTDDIHALVEAAAVFRQLGFEIAIDDLGSGYSSLQLWSELKPDYVKIDRHFIQGIDSDNTKQEFIRAMYAISQITNTRILAEGVETQGELEVLRNIGLNLFQGYLFAKPEAIPKEIDLSRFISPRELESKDSLTARQLICNQTAIQYHRPVQGIIKQLQANPDLNSIAVVDGTKPIGMIHRKRFLTHMSRQYVMDLATHKRVADFMDTDFLQIDANFRLEQVSKLVTNRARIHAEEDFVISDKGEFLGCGQVIDLLRQITEIQIKSARHANPLTLLPGNVPIGDCVNRLIKDGREFIISYLDLDNFKPFNDRYGYAKGDQVLLLLSDLLKQYLNVQEGDFVGHIGGDDFIAVSQDGEWMEKVFNVLDTFSREIIKFYDDQDIERGGIEAFDRFGVCHFYDVIGLSVGSKRIDPALFHSFMDVSKELAQVKQLAKSQKKGEIVFDDGESVIILNRTRQRRLIQPIQSSVYLNEEQISVSF